MALTGEKLDQYCPEPQCQTAFSTCSVEEDLCCRVPHRRSQGIKHISSAESQCYVEHDTKELHSQLDIDPKPQDINLPK